MTFGRVKNMIRDEATYGVSIEEANEALDDIIGDILPNDAPPQPRPPRAERGKALAKYLTAIIDAYERATTRGLVVSAFRQAGICYKIPDPKFPDHWVSYVDRSEARAVKADKGLFLNLRPVDRPAPGQTPIADLILNPQSREGVQGAVVERGRAERETLELLGNTPQSNEPAPDLSEVTPSFTPLPGLSEAQRNSSTPVPLFAQLPPGSVPTFAPLPALSNTRRCTQSTAPLTCSRHPPAALSDASRNSEQTQLRSLGPARLAPSATPPPSSQMLRFVAPPPQRSDAPRRYPTVTQTAPLPRPEASQPVAPLPAHSVAPHRAPTASLPIAPLPEPSSPSATLPLLGSEVLLPACSQVPRFIAQLMERSDAPHRAPTVTQPPVQPPLRSVPQTVPPLPRPEASQPVAPLPAHSVAPHHASTPASTPARSSAPSSAPLPALSEALVGAEHTAPRSLGPALSAPSTAQLPALCNASPNTPSSAPLVAPFFATGHYLHALSDVSRHDPQAATHSPS